MATRKTKRYDDGGMTDEFGDLEGAMEAAKTRAVQDQFDANEAASVKKPSPQKLRSVGDSLINKARNEAKAEAKAEAKPEVKTEVKPTAKKEMYRDFGGKMREKAPDTSSEDAAARREKVGSFLRGAASSVGDYLSNLGKREEKHGTYVRNGKVERYAKGGATRSSASSRADGIASKGKTRGKIC